MNYKITKKFTLLEMIVATAIFAIVMMTVGVMFFSINSSRNKIKIYKNHTENIIALDKVFTNSFRNAIPFDWKDDNNKNLSIFIGTQNNISFAYKHRINYNKDTAIRFLAFSLNDNNLIATYSNTPIVPWLDSQTNAISEIIANNVESISFTYAAKNDNSIIWVDSWNEEFENIPLAIQIKIIWEDGSQEQWLSRVAGASLYETYGNRKDDDEDKL